MKRKVLVTILVASGSAALAQQAPVASKPAAPLAPVPIAVATATNLSGRMDLETMRAAYKEFTAIDQELRSKEEALQKNDPDIQALFAKRTAAQQAVRDLNKEYRDLVDKKLAADPALAAKVAKRQQMQQKLEELRRQQPAFGVPRGPMMRPQPPASVTPPAVPAAAAAPAAKAAEAAK